MIVQNKRSLSAEQFVWIFFVEERVYMPPAFCLTEGPEYYQFTTNTRDLLKSNPYTLWFTDPGRKKWLNPVKRSGSRDKRIEQRNLTPISFPELLNSPLLLKKKQEELKRGRPHRKKREMPHAITMYCKTCMRRVLLDGNHGFLNLCVDKINTPIVITETAHDNWVAFNGRTMSGICVCNV